MGEHALGEAGDLSLQVGVAQRAVFQDGDEERAPFVADAVQDLADEGGSAPDTSPTTMVASL